MTMKKRVLAVVSVILLATIIYDLSTNPLVSGSVNIRNLLTISLPKGSRHRIQQGIDSFVGQIKLGWLGKTMKYDIGHLAGNYATSKHHGPFVFQKQEVNNGVTMDYSLLKERAQYTLFVSFPDLGPANFYTQISDPSHSDAILDVMRTVRPIEPR